MRTLRTILLSIIMLGLIVPAFAQQTAPQYRNLPENVQFTPGYFKAVEKLEGKKDFKALPENAKVYGKEFKAENYKSFNIKSGKNNDKPMANPTGVLLGSAWFDRQTWGCMPHRISTFMYSPTEPFFNIAAMGTAAGSTGKADVTSFGGTTPTYSSFGTYFQFVDFSGDEPQTTINWNRLEKFPSYSGSVGQFTEGKAAAVSFPYPLQVKPNFFITNEDIGSDVFTVDTIPNSPSFFPRTTVDGNNNVHVIYDHLITGETDFGEVGYRRSADGGKTWANETMFTGNTAQAPKNAGLESYAIDAEGQQVVFAYVDKNLNFIYKRSNDGGQTWSPLYLIWRLENDTLYTKKDPSGIYNAWTDTTWGPGMLMDAMIDANGDYHFVVNVMCYTHQGEVTKDGQGNWQWTAGTDSVKYTNLYYPRIGFLYAFIPKDTTVNPTYNFAGPPSDGEFTPQQNHIVPFQYQNVWVNDSMPSTFCVADPNLGYDPDGTVYLTYSTIRDSINTAKTADKKSMILTQSGQALDVYNRHIFATKYDKLAKTWSQPVSLSPNGWDCGSPSLAKKLIKKKGVTRIPVLYTADTDPSCYVRFTGIFNMTEEPKLYMYPFRLQDYSAGVGVEDEVTENAQISVQPNPVNDIAYIYYTNAAAGNVQVDLYNMLGQKVQNIFNGISAGGVQSYVLRTENLNSGSYFCKITSGNSSLTKTIVISK